MENKSMTDIQVQVLILAMLGVEPRIINIKPYEYDVSIKQINTQSIQKDGMLGLEINFHLTWFGEFAHHPIDETYLLFIAYYDTYQQSNPSFIKLARTEGDEPGVIPIGNLVFIIDKLREYGIW